jgi:hypothetical protein
LLLGSSDGDEDGELDGSLLGSIETLGCTDGILLGRVEGE